MDAIETAIRNAFDKGDAFDPAYRQRVYRSAVAAMEKALQANQSLAEEAMDRRREAVRQTIDQIESEFVPAVGADFEPAAAFAERAYPEPEFPSPPAVEIESREADPAYAEPRIGPDVPLERRDRVGDRLGGVGDNAGHRGDKRGGWLMRLLPAAIVILVTVAAIWWAASNGLFRAPDVAESRTDAPPAVPATQPESQTGGRLLPERESQDWITVFSPSDPTQVTAPSNASAEVLEDDSGRFMRIRSGADGAPVGFGVGQGILERTAGRIAVFNIIARAEEGMPSEISVECDFAGLGGCGRKRYQVNYERGDYLFEVEMPDGTPAGGGTISIVSDVENAGKGIDVYEIGVSVNE